MRVAENQGQQRLKNKTKPTNVHEGGDLLKKYFTVMVRTEENPYQRSVPFPYLLLGGNCPEVPHVSACLPSRAPTAFVPNYFFKNVCLVSSLKKPKDVSLWSKGKFSLLSIIKDSGSLSSGFLSVMQPTHGMFSCHITLFTLPCGDVGSGNHCKKMLVLWLLLLL